MDENEEIQEKKIPEVIAFTESTDDHPWHKPGKDEKLILAASMFFKYLRLILTNIILVGNAILPCFIPMSITPCTILVAILGIVLIIYANYRRYDIYFLTSSMADPDRSKLWMAATVTGTLVAFITATIIGAFVPGVHKYLAVIPPTIMLIILQIKEWYMLILLVRGKYKIKNGMVLSGEKEIRIDKKILCRFSEEGLYPDPDLTLIISYAKTFCDIGGRTLTVFTDFYTYHFARRSKPAMLLSFDNGWYVIAKGGRKKTRS